MGIGPSVATWDEWASIHNNLETWRGLIHAILNREGITYNTLEKGFPGTSAVFLVDHKYVIKIYPGLFINDHKREWPVLKLLKSLVDKPLLISSGHFKDDTMNWPYAILRYIEGTAYRELAPCLNEREKYKFTEQLTNKLHKIHRLPFDSLKDVSDYQWNVSDNEVHNQVEKLCRLPFFNHDNFKMDLFEFIKREKPLLEQQEFVLVHGDLTKDHLFFNKENGEWLFTDIIDWGDAHIAPAHYDLVVLWAEVFSNQTSEWQNFLQQFNQGYESLGRRFESLFTAMLFLHPFARDLILNAYKSRSSTEQPKSFHTVLNFTQWIFSE